MTPTREALVRTLLHRCYSAYSDGSSDIPTFGNTIETYLSTQNQQKYVAMYFAKYVAAWRWIRRHLANASEGPVWSIGAGPCLCLLGWFWDQPPSAHQDVLALDLAPWDGVRSFPEFKSLWNDVCGGAKSAAYDYPRYFPVQLPPQASGLTFAAPPTPIIPNNVPENATVLLPMVLNHVIGVVQPHEDPHSVFDWLRQLAARVRRVVIVEMPHDRTPDFWRVLWNGLGYAAPPAAQTFQFLGQSAEFAGCFPNAAEGARRTGARYPQFCVLSGAVHTRGDGQWRYFSGT